MIGLKLPDYARLSPRVATVLGQNPSPFTGPGTNTYLLGTGHRPILLDTGQGVAIYPDLLARALKELSGAETRPNRADACPRRSYRRRPPSPRKIRRPENRPESARGRDMMSQPAR